MALHPAPTIEDHLALIVQPITHSLVGHTAVITLGAFAGGGVTAQQVADRFFTAFKNRFISQLDDQCSILQTSVSLGNGSSTPTVAIAAGAVAAGVNAITTPSPQVCCVFRKYSGVGGRKNRGRTYFPWIVSAGQIDQAGVIVAGVVTTLQGQATLLLGDMVTQSIPMCIANKTLATDPVTGKKYVTHIGAGPSVTSWVVETHVGTQRRRLVRQ